MVFTYLIVINAQYRTSKGQKKYLPVVAKDEIHTQSLTIAAQAKQIRDLKRQGKERDIALFTINEAIEIYRRKS